jgi:hypothetical protein
LRFREINSRGFFNKLLALRDQIAGIYVSALFAFYFEQQNGGNWFEYFTFPSVSDARF